MLFDFIFISFDFSSRASREKKNVIFLVSYLYEKSDAVSLIY